MEEALINYFIVVILYFLLKFSLEHMNPEYIPPKTTTYIVDTPRHHRGHHHNKHGPWVYDFHCGKTTWGCCPDGVTVALDKSATNCY